MILLALAIVVVVAGLLLLPIRWPDALVGSRIVESISIDATPERIFDYVATPANWPHWHPASRGVRGVAGRPLAIGDRVVETFEVGGRTNEATWTMVELERPLRWRIVAEGRGGGGADIRYRIDAGADAVRFERDLRYRGPNLVFGILNALRIDNIMRRDSAQALANIKRYVEGRVA